MRKESDYETEDCGIHLVPISVSKTKGVEHRLRKEIKFLSNLRQEYELNMLEVKKELLDEKINKREVEDQRQEFSEVINRGRIEWDQERGFLEQELMEAREKVAELKGKLRLKDEVVKELEKTNNFMKHQLTLRFSSSVIPKEEKVAVVDNSMEMISLSNQLAAKTACMERLERHNKELQQKVDNLVGENTDLKNQIEKLQVQVSTPRRGGEKPKAEFRSLGENFRQVELLRKTLEEKNSASRKRFDQVSKLKKKLLRKEQLADRLVAWVKVRNKIEEARDAQEVLTIGDQVLGSEKKKRNRGRTLPRSTAKKVVDLGRLYSPDLTTIFDKASLSHKLKAKKGVARGRLGDKSGDFKRKAG